MSVQAQRPLLLLSAYARTLAHKLRTPLSVVSNDLFCLDALNGSADTKRALANCKELSRLISLASVKNLAASDAKFELVELVSEICGIKPPAEIAEPIFIRGDQAALKQALCSVQALLGAHALALSLAAGFSLELECTLPVSVPGEYDSLTEYFLIAVGSDDINPIICDATLWAFGFEQKLIVPAPGPERAKFLISLSLEAKSRV